MGIYLAKPSTDISCEMGEGAGVEYAVGEMQGWRKHMEDAHISITEMTRHENQPVSVFGVFDGHGGKEVAKFVRLKYPALLADLESFRSGDYAKALRESFHGIDELLENEEHDKLLKELRALPNPSDGPIANQRNPANFVNLSNPPSINRAQDDSNLKGNKSVPAVRVPSPDSDAGDESPVSPKNSDGSNAEPLSNDEAIRMIRELLDGARKYRNEQNQKQEKAQPGGDHKPEISPTHANIAPGTTPSSFVDEDDSVEDSEGKNISFPPVFSEAINEAVKQSLEAMNLPEEEEGEQEATNDQQLMVINDEKSLIEFPPHGENKLIRDLKEEARDEDKSPIVHPVFEKSEASHHQPENGAKEEETPAVAQPTAAAPPVPPAPASIVSASGNLICNLKDHRVLAGCTAVVALLVGKKLYVANAGDSRGVMMRAGTAVALSEDHKPNQERELNRITHAGGYVNAVGRVNGNLNLSRSLGDLKYKQLKHLLPEQQIITAEPDVTEFDVQAEDEFFILACDGIWDCLTNQEACDLVKEGLTQGHPLERITKDVLKKCLADDPRKSQGIGGDNMTFLVVEFGNHHKSS